MLDADEVAVAARLADRLDERDAAGVGGVDRRAGRREEVDAVVQVAGPRAAEVAAATDDAGCGCRELAAPGCGIVPSTRHARARSMTMAADSVPAGFAP